jgi:hypothetical protein
MIKVTNETMQVCDFGIDCKIKLLIYAGRALEREGAIGFPRND